MKEHEVSYDALDNENVKRMLEYMEHTKVKESQQIAVAGNKRYELYNFCVCAKA